MIHFTVLVVGDDVEKQLAPFQENNMGDCPREYMEFNEIEEEYRHDYENESVEMVQAPNGERFYSWDRQFKVGDIFDQKTVIPEDYEKVLVAHKDRYDNFDEFIRDWAGYKDQDPETGKYGYWENPQAKWDWFQVGGRWTGFFKMKPLQLLGTNQVFFDDNGFSPAEVARLTQMRKENPEQFEAVLKKYKGKEESIRQACDLQDLVIYPEHAVGSPGILTSKAEPGYADSARKRDIDFDGMRDEAGEKAGKTYDKMLAVIGAHLEDFISWDKMRDEVHRGNVEAARTAYHDQPAKKALLQAAEDQDLRWNNIEDFLCTKEEYVEKARAKAISTFAVLMDGKWYEKGEMGWWACVSNENADWSEEFGKLLDGIEDDTLLTVVDCHI